MEPTEPPALLQVERCSVRRRVMDPRHFVHRRSMDLHHSVHWGVYAISPKIKRLLYGSMPPSNDLTMLPSAFAIANCNHTNSLGLAAAD
ncbi:hypothetical protein Ddye_004574 [Dipteronia dyeriana]|uniref:Uncharacterized protein n=1 Tax=Dipteronia dyeriana TaxID=168575 RepID=A0AAD9XV10_9ROSI|nr:hypothetical protein Ddye_004574 [Dipteronia dyeriana]